MRNLVIDIGNTRVKYGLFDRQRLVKVIRSKELKPTDILRLVTNHDVQNIIYSTVAEKWPAELDAAWGPGVSVRQLTEQTRLPFVNAYATPATLGKDRVAAVAGAQEHYPESHCLVIDAGTCITLDVLRADGVYLGGNIAPGVRMRLRAMHEFTARLPLVDARTEGSLWGTSTETALQNGGVLGAVLEIEALAGRLRRQWPDLQIVLTGGDADFLAERTECEIFVHSNLVLEGLNKILNYNVEQLA